MNLISHWHDSFDAISDPVLLQDKNFTILRINAAYARTFNITPEEATGKQSLIITEYLFKEELKSGKGFIKELYVPDLGLYLEIVSYSIFDDSNELEGMLIYIKNVSAIKRLVQERETLFFDLREALAKIRQLSGLLPICRSCRKIRDDKSYWNQIESYLLGHSEPELAHGVCPDCLKKIYPEYHEVQCWEHMKCGQETDKTCPVVLLEAGRACWNVSQTLCGGTRQGGSTTKLPLCLKCEFFVKLNHGEI
jgi:hypothetical protein